VLEIIGKNSFICRKVITNESLIKRAIHLGCNNSTSYRKFIVIANL
jgi:hypothetical protein